MSSNTNIGNTPVNQGYVQLIHTGETGGIDGTLRTLYDGDGTASDLQIASNKVKISTELYIGSKTITEYVQDVVGDMFDTNGSHTNITATYDDNGDGAIDLVATGAISGITGGTGINATGSGNITIAIDSTVATLTGTQTLTNKTLASPTFTGTANGANLTLTGDLTVSGDTIFTNSNTVLIGDAILTLNADETGSPTANAGFEVERGTSTNKTFIWNETDDKWTIGSETFVASTVEANLTGNVTGNVTGSASLNLLKSSNLSDLANVATARTNLGVDVAGTDNSTDVTLVTTSHDYLSLAGQAITLGTIDISDDTNLVGGTGITLTGDTLSTTDSEIVHDNLSGFVANEHKDHSAISITTAASSGLSGGGDITTTRSLSVDVNNLDVQVPDLELPDKIAIYDNSVGETNVATLTQLKAIVNTDTDTNQLTTFNVSGDSGTDQTISHNNTLTISGGNGISTSTSATDILSVALGGFSTLIGQSSPAEQDLLVIEEAIGGAIKKVQIGALSSGITIDGTTANGILTYGGVDNIDTESNLTFDATTLKLAIGNASPDAHLHIGDNSSNFTLGTTSGDSIDLLKLETDSTNANQLIFSSERIADGSTWTTTRERIYRRVDASSMGYIQFGSSFSASVADMISFGEVGVGDYMGITGDGKVGIGVASPGALLDVGGRIHLQSDGVLKWGASANAGNLTWDTGVAIVGSQSGIDLDLRAASGKNILFKVSSSEKMRLDSSGNVGIGNNSPTNFGAGFTNLQISGSTAGVLQTTDSTNSATTEMMTSSGVGYVGTRSNHQVRFKSNNSTAMTIDTSQRVGIGTTTPGYKLQVSGGDIGIDVGERLYFGGGNHTYISEDVDDRLRFFTGGDEFMRFTQQDAGGEIFSIYQDVYLPDDKKIHFGGGNDLEIYHDGTNDIINTKGNAFKLLDSGQERFTINSAGNIQFNNAQTDVNTRFGTTGSLYTLWVDGGNDRVGIGTNSPSVKLHINDNDVLIGNNSNGYATLNFHSETTGSARYASIMKNYDSPFDMRIRASNSTAEMPLVFDGSNDTEYARFDTSGNFGIGTVSPAQKLHTNGTAGDTRTRTSTSNHGTYFESGVTSDSAGILLVAGHASSILNIYLQGAGGTQNQFRFTHNGDFLADEDIVAYSTSVGSDRKLKDNIKDTSYGLSDVMKMRAVEFDWKEKRDKAHDIGVIAQEIEEIIPEVVKEVETLNTDGETHKVVDYAKLSSVLIKAIQEQQEQINKLERKLNG